MAEGGSYTSITDGSDACVEHYCTPCGEDNEEAVKYCPDCDEYLCKRCTRQHTRQNATKAHTLVDKSEAKHSRPDVRTKCIYHPNRDIEMFCGTHDMVYCTMCIATDHRTCEQIGKIESDSMSAVNQTEVNNLFDEINTAKENLINDIEKQSQNLSTLEEQKVTVQGRLGDIEKRLVKHIRELKQEADKSVSKMYNKLSLGLQSEIKSSSRSIESLKEHSQRLQSIDSLSTEQQFICLKLAKKATTDARDIHAQCFSKGTCSLSFTENVALAEYVSSVDSFGQVLQEDKQLKKPKEFKFKEMKDLVVKVKSDKYTCTISDICQLPDGRLLLTDRGNCKVKMLDVKYNVLDSCVVEDLPTAISCVNNNEVAVKLCNNIVQFISTVAFLSKTRCFSVCGGNFSGMAYFDGGLWVSSSDSITVYKKNGTLIKSIDNILKGKPISTFQYMTVTCDTVIVADWSDGVVLLNKDGTVMRELRDSRLQNSCGVCVADDGTVFVSGHSSNNIVMFNMDGKCQGEIVRTGHGLSDPLSMCYDRNKNTLIVTTWSSETIKVLEFEE